MQRPLQLEVVLNELVQVNLLVTVGIHLLEERPYYVVETGLELDSFALSDFLLLDRLLNQEVLELGHGQNAVVISVSFVEFGG